MKVLEAKVEETSKVHKGLREVGVRSLLFTAIVTQPNIARTASKLSKQLRNPLANHLAIANQYIFYLYGTYYLTIQYSACGNSQETTTTSFSMEIHAAQKKQTTGPARSTRSSRKALLPPLLKQTNIHKPP